MNLGLIDASGNALAKTEHLSVYDASGKELGLKGDTGSQGPQGDPGPTGPPGADATAPVGAILMYGGTSAPAGWLICDGASLLRAGTYAALFAVIGTAFGSADGTHFNLPDMRARFPMGLDSANGHSIGTKGGAASVLLQVAELPPHTHSMQRWSTGSAASQPDNTLGTHPNATPVATNMPPTGSTGGGSAHENRPPYLEVNFIIKY